MSADVVYYFVVDGFNGAYGTWQFDLAALDNSTVEGSLLSTAYGLAVAGTTSTSTTSKTAAGLLFCSDFFNSTVGVTMQPLSI